MASTSNSTLWIIGPAGAGSTTSLNVTTFPPSGSNGALPTAQLLATDTGGFSSTVQLLSLPDGTGGKPATGLQVRQTWNTNGSIALPTMPNKPATGTADLTIDSFGNVTPQTSSARFKTDIEPLAVDFQRILALEPKAFRDARGDRGIGYVAEEVADLSLPDLVSLDEAGQPLSVHYKLISLYVLEIVKAQQKEISDLRRKLDALDTSLA